MSWTSLRVPASSANLGPGFDALGLALNIYLECRFQPGMTLSFSVSGVDAESIPSDESNLIWQTAARLATREHRTLPLCEIIIHNQIPLGKGLGSSAAALTAGVVMADHLLNLGWGRGRILNEAAQLEGHPDNVAAAVWGGVVASAMDDGGSVCALRLDLPPSCGIAVVIPAFALPTSQSRAVLPLSWSRADVIFNLQRSALLIAALATANLDALSTALRDRLHQPYRAALVPGLAEVLQIQAPGLIGCVLSGAGPSVLVFYKVGHAHVCGLIHQALERTASGAALLPAEVSSNGYELRDL